MTTAPAGLGGRGLDMALEERTKQIDLGHSVELDRCLPPHTLPTRAHDYVLIAIDVLRAPATSSLHDVPRARRKLAQAAALCMAAIDALTPEEGDMPC